jgi:hypothetical protein
MGVLHAKVVNFQVGKNCATEVVVVVRRENQLQMKGEGKGCLAQQLVMVLQHMPLRSATAHSQEESHIQTPLQIEASTQTAQTETTGPQDLGTHGHCHLAPSLSPKNKCSEVVEEV